MPIRSSFEFVHKVRKRGKTLLASLLECLLRSYPWNPQRATAVTR